MAAVAIEKSGQCRVGHFLLSCTNRCKDSILGSSQSGIGFSTQKAPTISRCSQVHELAKHI